MEDTIDEYQWHTGATTPVENPAIEFIGVDKAFGRNHNPRLRRRPP